MQKQVACRRRLTAVELSPWIRVLFSRYPIGKRQGPSCLANAALHRVNKHHSPTLHHHHPALPISKTQQSTNKLPTFDCGHLPRQHVLQRAHEHGAHHYAQSACTPGERARRLHDLGRSTHLPTLEETNANRRSRTMKSPGVYQTSASSSPSQTYRSRTPRSSKKFSNGWPNCS